MIKTEDKLKRVELKSYNSSSHWKAYKAAP